MFIAENGTTPLKKYYWKVEAKTGR